MLPRAMPFVSRLICGVRNYKIDVKRRMIDFVPCNYARESSTAYQLIHLMYFSISYQIASLLSSRELNQTYVYPNCLLVRCEIISSYWKTRILMKEIANSGFVKEPLELFGNCISTTQTFSNSLELDTWLL